MHQRNNARTRTATREGLAQPSKLGPLSPSLHDDLNRGAAAMRRPGEE
jgi:hypothetical protein